MADVALSQMRLAASRQLATIFQISLYGLLAYAGWILGQAEGAWIPYGTIIASVLGLFLTEKPRNWGLSPGWSHAAGLAAVIFAGREFFSDNPEGRLLSGAHLVCYATWIVLLQQKGIRQYWSLFALGMLQVAVAAVLTKDTWYGVSLVLFVMAAIWTLSVFSLVILEEQFRIEPQTSFTHQGSDEVLWFQETADVYNGVRHSERGRWLTLRFAGGVACLAVLALGLSALFFMFTPRLWIGQRLQFGDLDPSTGRPAQSLTGFSQDVRIGELGQILESVDPVLSIRLFDTKTGQPIGVDEYASQLGQDEPLFRAGVLTKYEQGRWTVDRRNDLHDVIPTTFLQEGIRQQCILEPIGTNILLHLGRPGACEIENGTRERAYRYWANGLMQRDTQSEQQRRIEYQVYSYRPTRLNGADGLQILPSTWSGYVRVGYFARNLELPETGLERLQALVKELIDQQEEQLGRKPTRMETARMLEHYLRDSGEFGYTLNLSVTDASIDPVEDFLFNRKEGHCEYFGTALALMLRSAGIPARLVSGFKGGEQKSADRYFEVQQRHAHVWVEAAVTADRWTILDATPGTARAEGVEAATSKLSLIARLRNSVSNVWSDYVLNVDLRQQQSSFYGPIREAIASLGEFLRTGGGSIATWFSNMAKFFRNPREWISITGGVVAAVLLLVLSGLVYGTRRFITWWQHRGSEAELREARRQRAVEFYQRFQAILKSVGLERTASQTQAEFVQSARQSLAHLSPVADLGAVSERLTRLFYRVRFGDELLTPEELTHAESDLEQLRQGLTKHDLAPSISR